MATGNTSDTLGSATADDPTADDDDSGGSLLKQTLMNVDECFLYKLPPLATSGGYRAEQWDLAKPIQTCGFQVERRNNDLYLIFTTESHSKLFALAKLHPDNAAKSVEPVLDSSRYFVVQIQAGTTTTSTTKSAYIGFGFRDRDVAIDLVGNLQQFQKSIQREQLAKTMKVAEIPKLAEGEKMHISFGNRSKKPATTDSTVKQSKSSSGVGGGGPLLLKKPPKVVETTTTTTAEGPTNAMTEVTAGLEKVQLVEEPSMADTISKGGGNDDDDDEAWGDFEQA